MIKIKKKFDFHNFAKHLQKARKTLVLRTNALQLEKLWNLAKMFEKVMHLKENIFK